MKKLWLIILTVLMSISFVFAFSACGDNCNGNPPAHEHTLGDYQSDDSAHWKVCETCLERVGQTAHVLGEERETETLKEGETCVYEIKNIAECSVCHREVVVHDIEVEKHDYELTDYQEATCMENGTKTYTCKLCGDVHEDMFANNEAHVYEGVTVDGVTTYTCVYCGDSYRVIDAKEAVGVTASSDLIAEVGAVELANATIALDQDVIDKVTNGNENIEIKADKTTAYALDIDENIKEAIGNNPVYDFTLKAGDDQISELGGNVTITVPYILGDGEDPDCIAIWYLSDGEPVCINAKYSNGFVTFETDHFSYYTVVRLSREETCALYGHNYVLTNITNSTCQTKGRITYICRRCSAKTVEEMDLVDHNYEVTANVPSTTTVPGYKEETCTWCGDVKRTEYPVEKEARDNFIENLITDILDNDLMFVEKEGEDSYYGYIIMDENGHRYPVSVSKYGTNLYDIDGTYYEIAYDNDGEVARYERYTESRGVLNQPDFIFSIIKNVMRSIPEEFTATAWEILKDNVLKITPEGDTVVITLDFEKIATTYRTIMNQPIKDSIDMLLGEGSFEGLTGIVRFALNSDIKTIINALKGIGFDIDDLIGFATEMMGVPIEITTDMIIESVGDMKILDLLSMPMALPMLTSMLPKSISEMLTPELIAMITPDMIIGMISAYGQQPLWQVVGMGEPVAEDFSVEDLFGMINAYGRKNNPNASVLTGFSFNLVATPDGDFISLDMSMTSVYREKENTMSISVTQETNDEIDIENIKRQVEEAYALLPDINQDNYNIFVSDLEEKFGLNFTYTQDEEGVVLVSDYVDVTEGEKTYQTYYKVYIPTESYSYVVKLHDGRNYLAKNFTRRVECKSNKNGAEDVYYYEWRSYRTASLIYDIETEKYIVSPSSINGDAIYIAIEEISEEEYVDNGVNYRVYEMYEGSSEALGIEVVTKYFKATTINGETEYFSRQYNIYNGVILEGEYVYSSMINLPFNKTVYGIEDKVGLQYEINEIGMNVTVDYSAPYETIYQYLDGYASSYFTSYAFENYVSNGERESVFGNMKLVIEEFHEEENYCYGVYTMYLNGIKVGTYGYNYCKHDYQKRTVIDGCNIYEFNYCPICGETYIDRRDNHEFTKETTVIKPYTATEYGIVEMKTACSKCGETHEYYFYTCCKHENGFVTEGDTHTCTICGLSYKGDIAPYVYMEKVDEEDGVLTFNVSMPFYVNDEFEGYDEDIYCVEKVYTGYKDDYYLSRIYTYEIVEEYFNDNYDAFKQWRYYEDVMDPFYSQENESLSYWYSAVANIGYYDNDGELCFVEGYFAQGEFETVMDETTYPVSFEHVQVSYDVNGLNAVIAELEEENNTDYFIVASLVDNESAEAFNYVLD